MRRDLFQICLPVWRALEFIGPGIQEPAGAFQERFPALIPNALQDRTGPNNDLEQFIYAKERRQVFIASLDMGQDFFNPFLGQRSPVQ